MKKLIMMLVLMPLMALADTEKVGGVTWSYTVADGMATVAKADPSSGALIIPSTLGGRPVTSIGSSAFFYCSGLTSVTIPSSITSIGDGAFGYCSALASVTIPEGVTNIGDGAFLGCSKLSAINVCNGNAVYASIDGVLYDKAKTKLMCCPGGKVGVVTIPAGVTSIGADAFRNCGGLTSATIPEGVTSIGSWAFGDCSSLMSVTIPNSVTSIGDAAFAGCGALTGVTIPVGVTRIASGAFFWCQSLTDVVLPSSVVSIGMCGVFGEEDWVGAFYGCDGLSRIWTSKNDTERIRRLLSSVGFNVNQLTFDEIGADDGVYTETIGGMSWSVKISEGIAMVGTGSSSDPAVPRETVGSIEVPSSVTGVWDGELHGCSGLGTISIPVTVTGIGGFAFSGCDDLTRVSVPSNITSIDDNAFRGCRGLAEIVVDDANPVYASVDGILYNKAKTKLLCCPEGRLDSLEIPSSVTSIGDRAFRGCSGLTSVTIPSSVTSIGEGAFYGCNKLKLIPVTLDSMEDVRALLRDAGVDTDALTFSISDKGGMYYIETVDGIDWAFEVSNGKATVRARHQTLDYWADVPIPSIDAATAGEVTIPSVLGDCPVACIGEYAFYGCGELANITIPEGVTEIRYKAFSGCNQLSAIVLPSTISTVVAMAFDGSSGLRAVYYSSSLPPSVSPHERVTGGWDSSVGYEIYDDVSSSLVSFVPWQPSSETWQGRQWMKWTPPINHTVQFDPNGGDCAVLSRQCSSGSTLGTLPTAAREGYEFLGWFTAAVGGTQVTAATVVMEDVTFYAQWRKIDETPIATYGPWGEAEAVKNPDKLGPTMLTDMTLEVNGMPGAVGDVVAAFRGDTGALCGLGKVMDESGTLTMACYAPTGVKLHFKVWLSDSGTVNPIIVDCDTKSDLTAPTSGAFLLGHALVVSDDKDLTISLRSADWHTVSFNVLPEDPSPAAVFGSVKAKIAAVTQGIEFWMPGKSSSLKAIEIGKGYWVNTKVDDVEWTVSGKTDPKVEIALEEGWNLVGYAPEAEGAVQQVLKTALAAKAVDYVTYGVEFYPGGTLKKMEPGKAYWVHAKKAWRLVYDEVVEKLKVERLKSIVGVGGAVTAPRSEGAAGTVLGAAVPTYGPWGESEAVKNPDKLGPTFLTDMEVEIDGAPAEYGDVVAVFRGDTGALCGLGKVMDGSGTLTLVCYAPKGVTLSFKVWLSESGVEGAVVVKCDNASKLVAPDVGSFYEGHAISGSTTELIETIVPGEKVTIDTGLVGYTVSGLPKGLSYSKTSGKITGSVSKPTAAEGVVVKFTKKDFETEELTIVVTAIPTVTIAMEGVNSPSDTDGCKVTGAGTYLVGKKVTLKATAPKGVVFMGWFDDEGVVATQATYSFTMGKEDVALVAKFKKEVMSVGCEGLSAKEYLPAGVAGAEGGIALDISTESGVKSVKVDKLPSGMKYDSKTGLITGAPTKAGDNTVVITVTAVSGAVEKREIKVSVAAMPVMAVGKFDGFVSVGGDNLGTFTLTTTDAGKLTAKVITAAGTVSFSGTCWDAVEKGVYRATLTTKKGEKLTLTLDSTAGWDVQQVGGRYSSASGRALDVTAQRNAFGKTWYFAATGDETTGWKLAYTEDTKGAALMVTLKADGVVSIAGKLPNGTDTKGKAVTFKVSASGYANVGGLKDGAILADFAPVLTVNKVKKVLMIETNLWFDRKNEVGRDIGQAKFVE